MHLATVIGGRREYFFAYLVGRYVSNHLELGAIFEHLGQTAINLGRLAASTEKRVDFSFDLAARHPDSLAKEEQQALGRLEPARGFAVDKERDDSLFRQFDSDHVTGEHNR